MEEERRLNSKDFILAVIGAILIVAGAYFLIVDLTPVTTPIQQAFPDMNPMDVHWWAKLLCLAMILIGASMNVEAARAT